MRTQRFSLEGETPARLELRWEGTTAHVFLDGEHASSLMGPAGLRRGWSVRLQDGSTLEVRAIRRALFPELSILRNGRHVASAPSHPNRMLVASSTSLIALSAFMLIAGALGVWGRSWISALFGAIYLLGALVLRARRPLGAAIIAVPLFINLGFLAGSAMTAGIGRRWTFDFLLAVMFATFVLRSYQAARD